MTSVNSEQLPCENERIAAYLDGELEGEPAALFERHLQDCAECQSSLQQQRRLLCALDLALSDHRAADIELPKNFSQIVAARAQSDLGSLRRERAEHGRALRLCLMLGLASFALLGGATLSEKLLKPAGLLLRHAGIVLGFAGRALYDFGAGLAVIARAVGGHTIFESYGLTTLVFLLLVIALVTLPRLISSYHRTHFRLERGAPWR